METSKSLLNIDWKGAAASTAEQIANRAAAVNELAGKDPRPLLLMLELDEVVKKKGDKKDKVVTLLQGALNASGMVGLKMNVGRSNLNRVLSELGALKNPTISNLTDPEWVAVETILEEKIVREIIPKLKTAGAQGIIEYPLNKVIY